MGTGWRESLGEQYGTERSRIGMTGAAGPVAWEGKISTLVQYVLDNGQLYRGMLGQQVGSGTSDPFWNVEHPKQSEWGVGVYLVQDLPGKHGSSSFTGN